jgi:hypothetical protein
MEAAMAIATLIAHLPPSKVWKANASHTGNLTKPSFKIKAGRFLRWRRKKKITKQQPRYMATIFFF